MPINTQHKDYKRSKDTWMKCLHFYEGEKSVKDQGTLYLPMLSGQNNLKYEAYKDRALFYNAVGRTVASLVSAVFRKEPAVQLPPVMEHLRQDATGTGVSLTELLIRVMTRMMVTGRVGILGDRDRADDHVYTPLPYLTLYDEVQIINWGFLEDGYFVVLEEVYESPNNKDKYVMETNVRYRELRFENGVYYQQVWTKGVRQGSFEVSETIQPLRGGEPMDTIPFSCISVGGLDFEVDKPPILDLVNVLHRHYCVAADYANALHTVCIPTPYITGMDAMDSESQSLLLGSDTAIFAPEVGSKVGFLEFQGQGLNPVEVAMTKMENMMAALGARLVETQRKSFVETAEGVRTREAAATAVLNSVISSVEQALNRVLRAIAVWEQVDPNDVSVKINRELVNSPVDSNKLNALVKALQDGAISFETFFYNLNEGGMYSPDATIASEKESRNPLIP